MAKVKCIHRVVFKGISYAPGEIIEVPQEIWEDLERASAAELFEASPPEVTKAEAPVVSEAEAPKSAAEGFEPVGEESKPAGGSRGRRRR